MLAFSQQLLRNDGEGLAIRPILAVQRGHGATLEIAECIRHEFAGQGRNTGVDFFVGITTVDRQLLAEDNIAFVDVGIDKVRGRTLWQGPCKAPSRRTTSRAMWVADPGAR